MTNNIQVLRQAGFFKEYTTLNEDELLETLHKIEKEKYSEIFGYEYEPKRKVDLIVLRHKTIKNFLTLTWKQTFVLQIKYTPDY